MSVWYKEWDLDDAEHTVLCLDHLSRALEELKQASIGLGRICCVDDDHRHAILDLALRIDGMNGLTETLMDLREDVRRTLRDDPRSVYRREIQ